MNPDWLGSYSDGGDSWEGGHRSIRFSDAGNGRIRFDYKFRSESNHGYDVVEHAGLVVDAGEAGIVVELVSQSSDSWEDLFKEHAVTNETSARRVMIEIRRLAQGKPVLGYVGATFTFAAK